MISSPQLLRPYATEDGLGTSPIRSQTAPSEPEHSRTSNTPRATQDSFSPSNSPSSSILTTALVARPAIVLETRAARYPPNIPPSNWRQVREPRVVDRPPAMLPNSPHQIRYNFGPRTVDYGVLFSEQQPGVIFRRWDIREIEDPNIKLGDPNVIEGPDGKLLRKKMRPFITLRRNVEAKTVDESPVYTNDNKGLSETSQTARWRFMSIMPEGITAWDFENQSPGNPVLRLSEGTDMDRKTMVVKFTEVFTRSMECDELRRCGRLESRSTTTLVQHANDHERSIGRK